MYESPQTRRLRSDLAGLERLVSESSILRFEASGKPANRYMISFLGRGLARDMRGKVESRDAHQVEIKLGSSYPRTMPELKWLTPIYHPNISEIGLVCLGGYGTHWVPSLHLDDLCVLLWDIVRYHNYDIRSPYNRDAALWAAHQTTFRFPVDERPLRDLRAAMGRIEPTPGPVKESTPGPAKESMASRLADFMAVRGRAATEPTVPPQPPPPPPPPDVLFLD